MPLESEAGRMANWNDSMPFGAQGIRHALRRAWIVAERAGGQAATRKPGIRPQLLHAAGRGILAMGALIVRISELY